MGNQYTVTLYGQNWLPRIVYWPRGAKERKLSSPPERPLRARLRADASREPVGGRRLIRCALPASTSVTARPRSAVVRISVRPGTAVRSASPEQHDARLLAFPAARDFDACPENAPGIDPVVIDRAAPILLWARFSVRTFPETSHHHRKTGSRQGCPGTWRGSRDHGWSSRARHLAHLAHLAHREADARHHGRRPVLRTPRASAGTSQPDVATGFKPLPGGHCLAVPGCACVEHDGQRGSPWRHIGSIVS